MGSEGCSFDGQTRDLAPLYFHWLAFSMLFINMRLYGASSIKTSCNKYCVYLDINNNVRKSDPLTRSRDRSLTVYLSRWSAADGDDLYISGSTGDHRVG